MKPYFVRKGRLLPCKKAVLGLAGMLLISVSQAQADWIEANRLVGAIGGWRVYAQEQAAPPDGYPMIPDVDNVLTPRELTEAPPSLRSKAEFRTWEVRQFQATSASLEAPTLTLAQRQSEAENSQEIGLHFPLGSWLENLHPLEADQESWGQGARTALQLGEIQDRWVAYADAVVAKAELAQTMDRLEAAGLLEEFTKRQRELESVPESALLSIRMERLDAEVSKDLAQEAFFQAVEKLGAVLDWAPSELETLQMRLPLELELSVPLPEVPAKRLDLQWEEEVLAQQRSQQARNVSRHWLGGLELGLIQERSSGGDTANTVELSWRLPLGGESRKQVDLGELMLLESEARLVLQKQEVEREQRELQRRSQLAQRHLEILTQSLEDAEFWMEEQLYKYNGMLIGPHDLLRASTQLRYARSRFIQAQRDAFVARLQAHLNQSISTKLVLNSGAVSQGRVPDANH